MVKDLENKWGTNSIWSGYEDRPTPRPPRIQFPQPESEEKPRLKSVVVIPQKPQPTKKEVMPKSKMQKKMVKPQPKPEKKAVKVQSKPEKQLLKIHPKQLKKTTMVQPKPKVKAGPTTKKEWK